LNTPPSSHQNQFQSQQQPGLFPQSSAISNANSSISGPPVTSLFDCLKNEKSFHTPSKPPTHSQSMFLHPQQQDNFMDNSGFNQSRVLSPIGRVQNEDFNHSFNTSIAQNIPSNYTNFWVTIFGFPQSAVTAILSHFSQCGSILEKICSSGNWMHVKFSSRIESDKALLYNGKIICDNIMIGVIRCNDSSIIDKENGNQNRNDVTLGGRIRSLTNAAYKAAQEPSDIILSPNQPKRSTGILNKTLDMFFGW
jgi:nuclear pore complex protein Nup53